MSKENSNIRVYVKDYNSMSYVTQLHKEIFLIENELTSKF